MHGNPLAPHEVKRRRGLKYHRNFYIFKPSVALSLGYGRLRDACAPPFMVAEHGRSPYRKFPTRRARSQRAAALTAAADQNLAGPKTIAQHARGGDRAGLLSDLGGSLDYRHP